MAALQMTAWYRQMLRIRLVEERIADLYPQQEMRCPVHLCIGQEAIAVGVCGRLRTEDYVLSAHRSHGHYLAKGGELTSMLAEIYGRASGCASGRGGSMHLIDREAGFLGSVPIVGSTLPIAVGAALGSAMRGEDRVTVVFFGDGATEEGVFHESLNFAALKKLPIVFVCENNFYSIYTPLADRQPPRRDLMRLAAGHGLAGARGDGNDVLEVDRHAADAVARARSGDGPTLLEFHTYRMREHCGPSADDHLAYRDEATVRAWRDRDPLRVLERHMVRESGFRPEDRAGWSAPIETEIDDAFLQARSGAWPSEESLRDHVYAR